MFIKLRRYTVGTELKRKFCIYNYTPHIMQKRCLKFIFGNDWSRKKENIRKKKKEDFSPYHAENP
jgi:hypothetical protein